MFLRTKHRFRLATKQQPALIQPWQKLFSYHCSVDLVCFYSISTIIGYLKPNLVFTYEERTISFKTFFVWALLLIVNTWNSRPLRSNLLWLQCTFYNLPTTSGRPHGNPLVWACQWPSSQPLSSPQLSHNDSLWAYGISKVTGSKVWTIGRMRNYLDVHFAQTVCDKDGVVDWCIVLVEIPLTRFEECWPLP